MSLSEVTWRYCVNMHARPRGASGLGRGLQQQDHKNLTVFLPVYMNNRMLRPDVAHTGHAARRSAQGTQTWAWPQLTNTANASTSSSMHTQHSRIAACSASVVTPAIFSWSTTRALPTPDDCDTGAGCGSRLCCRAAPTLPW